MLRDAGDGFGCRVTDIAQRKHELFGQQESRCGGCEYDFPFRIFTVDHMITRSKGGTDHLGSLQLLCAVCNSLTGDRAQECPFSRLIEQGTLTPMGARIG